MIPTDAPDAPAARLDALERAAAPALLVGPAGAIAWANAAARALGAGDLLEPAAARAVAAAAGLVRLRLGAAGRFEPLTFRASRLDAGDSEVRMLLEATAAPARRPGLVREAGSPLLPLAGEGRDEGTSENSEGDGWPTAPHPDPLPQAGEGDGAVTLHLPTFTETDATENGPAPLEEDRPPDPRLDAVGPERPDSAAPADAAPRPSATELRFVFEIDAERRIAFLSPDLAAVVGDSAARAVGRLWPEVADELALDPEGAVTEALGGRRGWSGLGVRWPLPEGGAVALALSALPMFDRGRTFVGFRGLGCAIAAAAAEPLSESPDAPEEGFAVEAQAPPADEPPAIVSAPRVQEVFGGNVVPLRDPASRQAALSSLEASAFDEIARRLAAVAAAPSARAVWDDIAADAGIALGGERPAPLGEIAPDRPHRLPEPEAGDLQRILDRVPVGALVLVGGAAVHANRAALDLTGHADLDALVAHGVDALFAERIARNDGAPASVRLIARDGVEVDVEARLAPIEWRAGPATLVTLKRDEAPGAGAASSARETELAAILDTATDGVMTLDGAGRILSLNRSAEALFGYEAREIVGSLFSLALAPESRRVAFDYLDGLRTNAVAALLNDGREVLGLVRQGGAIPLYLTLGRIGSGEDGRYCAVLRDITHWKKAEEELLAAKRQAERASAQKSDFLAKVSHEIRTPLNAIIGFAEVMMEERFGAIGNARYKDYLRDIHLSGGHIVSLVNDLLDLTRIESGRMELDLVDVDLNETVAQAVALLQPQANRAHIIIRTSLARGLPRIRADRRSVRQIVLNLASNAVKFTQGGGQVIVATALTDLGDAVIRVRDTGVGMSKKEVALALEPFRQLPTSGAEGAGLGLPLTKALAEANQATFAIHSAVGEGTLVEIAFPGARAAAG